MDSLLSEFVGVVCGVLGMKFNHIWWWGHSLGALGNVEYPFQYNYFKVYPDLE